MNDRNATAEVPIACSLTGSEARERVNGWRTLVRDALLRSVSGDGYVDAAFRNEPATRVELEALVVAERACCGFLAFELRQREAELVLTVTAMSEETRNDLAISVSSLGLDPVTLPAATSP